MRILLVHTQDPLALKLQLSTLLAPNTFFVQSHNGISVCTATQNVQQFESDISCVPCPSVALSALVTPDN